MDRMTDRLYGCRNDEIRSFGKQVKARIMCTAAPRGASHVKHPGVLQYSARSHLDLRRATWCLYVLITAH